MAWSRKEPTDPIERYKASRMCAWAECGKLFVQVRGQERYCSAQCAHAAERRRNKIRHGQRP